jgi:hypothetical protein
MTADKSEEQPEQILEFLPEAELLAIPESNFSPGILAAIWQRKATLKEEQVETELTLRHDRLQQRAELSREHDAEHLRAEILFRERMQEVEERSERLLVCAQEEELLAREHLKQVESRALVLADGRRAYVDGTDNYRDENGAALRWDMAHCSTKTSKFADRAARAALLIKRSATAAWPGLGTPTRSFQGTRLPINNPSNSLVA